MDIVTVGPYRVASFEWRPARGGTARTVVCKTTFVLAPGELAVAEALEPLYDRDRHVREDAMSSVAVPSDLAPFKARADVVVVGHAYATRGKPAASLVARVGVADVDKSIQVVGERARTSDGRPGEPAPFEKMPLLYELAAAGATNPAGIPAGGGRWPNLVPVGVHTGDASAEAIGLGPIAPAWPSRREKLGGLPGLSPSWTNEPLPAAVDSGFFNVAPRDQQAKAIRPDESITLRHLSPEHTILAARLPGSKPRAFVERAGGEAQELALVCDTLLIDTDRQRCVVVWRGQTMLDVASPIRRVAVVVEEAGTRVGWEEALRMIADPTWRPARTERGAEGSAQMEATAAVIGGPSAAALPFQRSAPLPVTAPPPVAAPAPVAPAPAQPSFAGAPVAPVPAQPSFAGAPASVAPVVAQPSFAGAPVAPAPAQPSFASAPVAPAPAQPSFAVGAGAGAMAGSIGQLYQQGSFPKQPAVEPLPEPAPAPPPRAQETRAPAPEPRQRSEEIFDLLWLDRERVLRVRKQPAWRPLLDALDRRAPDDELDEAALTADPDDGGVQRDVFEILACAAPTEPDAVREAFGRAVREDGKLVAPLALLGGELQIVFDEVELLKAMIAAASPFLAGDTALRNAVDEVQALLPRLAGPAGVEPLAARLRDAFGATKRPVAATWLDTQAERSALERRKYQEREVWGVASARALLWPSRGAGPALPVYVPLRGAKRTPLLPRFPARILAEIALPQEAGEAPHALRALAIARVVPPPPKGRA